MNINLSFIVALWISGLATCLSQQKPINIKFRAAIWDDQVPNEMVYVSKGKLMPLKDLQAGLRSEPYTYTGSAEILFYDKSATLDQPGSPIARITLAKDNKSPFLLFLKNPDSDGLPFRIVATDDSLREFPFPSFRFVSFLPVNVAVNFDKRSFQIRPGETKTVTSDAEAIHVQFAVAEEGDSQWKLFSDDFHPNWPDERTIIFFAPGGAEGVADIQMQAFPEAQSAWRRYVSYGKSGTEP